MNTALWVRSYYKNWNYFFEVSLFSLYETPAFVLLKALKIFTSDARPKRYLKDNLFNIGMFSWNILTLRVLTLTGCLLSFG